MKITVTKDYEVIAKLNEPVQNLHADLYPDRFKRFAYEPVRDFVMGMMHDPNSVFLLLEDEGPLGYAWIEFRTYQESLFRKAYQSVYVHQISVSVQHKGYGSALMNHIYEMARSRGIGRVELDYWCDNSVAKEFYRKQGFVKYRELVYKEV
ncbi:GNAT family N-acetyltransferase [Ectobacillus ponti]|uniref:GNAT family N-acetyltransferase n=1 Tax=Ectobacillus ponti TaxID=2961894 RepID=A0AA41XD52_9BACI|nr:GNAT family N-acetyltransferase [Ectobacillus ponti]MCP8970695.1 GNAT family N-acetyltransferase [Ectobacillus ponti]